MSHDRFPVEEYEALRQEILQWQRIRFTVAGLAVTISGAVLAYFAKASTGVPWQFPPLIILWVLTWAALMSYMFGRCNCSIGTYIGVFMEHRAKGWENRKQKFRTVPRRLSMNTGLGLMYMVLGTVSIIESKYVATVSMGVHGTVLLTVTAAVFAGAVTLLMFKSYPREQFSRQWERIKADEQDTSRSDANEVV